MPVRRPEARLFELTASDYVPPSESAPPSGPIAALWIPRDFVRGSSIDALRFVQEMNDVIARRGVVLYDGQVLTTTIPPDAYVIDEGAHEFSTAPRREWGNAHERYFCLSNPYQMSEDQRKFTSSHIYWRVQQPYIDPDERIIAILDGRTDDRDFTCGCHFGHVVYTTRDRLVCMMCGALHAVLLVPLQLRPKRGLTTDEWSEYFDRGGSRHDEQLEMSVIDFRDVENAPMLWVTDQWLDARHEFIFFARSSEEMIWEAIRGTERDPSIFLEAGFTGHAMPPSPAQQLREDTVEVDLVENAGLALAEGATCFVASRTEPSRLVHAIPHLFRAIELLLKACLHHLDHSALDDQPRAKTVIARLAAHKVVLTNADRQMLGKLRTLRNQLQHDEARFNHRVGLSLCRGAIIFLDRFAQEQLALWVREAIPTPTWQALLDIPEIATTAARETSVILNDVRSNPNATITQCLRCQRDTMVRPHPSTGASCVYCGHIPRQVT
jgi:ribosomal protein S27E